MFWFWLILLLLCDSAGGVYLVWIAIVGVLVVCCGLGLFVFSCTWLGYYDYDCDGFVTAY